MEIPDLKGVIGFEWDMGNLTHIARHNVTSDEAEEVFSDRDNVWQEDIEHSTNREIRYLIIGKTEKGRLLYQVFIRRGNKIRVLSSRDAHKKKEVALYEETT